MRKGGNNMNSDEIAEAIKKIALNENLNTDEVREQIRAEDEKAQRKCFGTKETKKG